MFRIKISEQTADKLRGMDKWVAAMIVAWIKKNLSKCVNPRSLGKSMFKKDNRFWQYRIGDFRLLAIIYDDSKLVVLTDINYSDTI